MSEHYICSEFGRFIAQWPVQRVLVVTGHSSEASGMVNVKLLLRGKAVLELIDGSALNTVPFAVDTAVVEVSGGRARPLWRSPGAMLYIRCRPETARLAMVTCRSAGDLEPQPTHYCTLSRNVPAVAGLALAIAELASEPAVAGAQVHALRALCMAAHAALSTETAPPLSRSIQLYDAIADHVSEHCLEPITREQVAASFSISPSHLSRLFQCHGAKSFSALLTRCRLQYARRLLLSTRLTISKIAFRCGYADASYFIRIFRQHTGCSPGRFRVISSESAYLETPTHGT